MEAAAATGKIRVKRFIVFIVMSVLSFNCGFQPMEHRQGLGLFFFVTSFIIHPIRRYFFPYSLHRLNLSVPDFTLLGF